MRIINSLVTSVLLLSTTHDKSGSAVASSVVAHVLPSLAARNHVDGQVDAEEEEVAETDADEDTDHCGFVAVVDEEEIDDLVEGIAEEAEDEDWDPAGDTLEFR